MNPCPVTSHAAGWDRAEIMAKAASETLLVTAKPTIVISTDEDLIVYLPRTATPGGKGIRGCHAAGAQRCADPRTGIRRSDLERLGPVTLEAVQGMPTCATLGR
jgi:hypothetical protein